MLTTGNYGTKVREARKAKKVSQAKLAQITGVSQQDISDIENNRIRDINTFKVIRINQALDLDIVETCINTTGYSAEDIKIARRVLSDIYGIEG